MNFAGNSFSAELAELAGLPGTNSAAAPYRRRGEVVPARGELRRLNDGSLCPRRDNQRPEHIAARLRNAIRGLYDRETSGSVTMSLHQRHLPSGFRA